MSDEMVQEKTGDALQDAPEIGGAAPAETVSSTGAAVPTDGAAVEPAPAQPAAEIVSAASPSAETAENADDLFAAAMQELDRQEERGKALQAALEDNRVVEGVVMRVDREGVLVDIGAKSEGIVKPNELSRDPNVNPEDLVKVGDRIKVYVLDLDTQDGVPSLSKKRADFEQAWDNIQQAKETGETIHAMVTDRVKGGLVVDLGIRGFVPASHVGTGSLKTNLDKYVGQSVPLKVIEVDKERRKVVLSNKLAVAEEREKQSSETKANLAPGQIRHGVVRRLTNYGAFIDLGGIDGLLHISEMSWTRINDPKEVLREGQELDVIVLKMDLENNRVSLGLRQILPDPWQQIGNLYKEGDTITGQVTRIVPFGAFVQVEGGVEGIIPNSEMPRGRGAKGGEAIAVNQDVEVKVLSLRPDERKMTLSMRALQPIEEQRQPMEPGAGNGPGSAPQPASEGDSGGRKRRGGRGGEREEDYGYAPAPRYVADEEPRFTLADAFAAAQKERSAQKERRRRQREEEVDDINAVDVDEADLDGGDDADFTAVLPDDDDALTVPIADLTGADEDERK